MALMAGIVLDPKVVFDNGVTALRAYKQGEYVQAFLLWHALTESLLRTFLGFDDQQIRFSQLIDRYRVFLECEGYPRPEFVSDLQEFNRRRNRIVHQLWHKGYSTTNRQAESAACAAMLTYGLFIEWLSTFDDSIAAYGFQVVG